MVAGLSFSDSQVSYTTHSLAKHKKGSNSFPTIHLETMAENRKNKWGHDMRVRFSLLVVTASGSFLSTLSPSSFQAHDIRHSPHLYLLLWSIHFLIYPPYWLKTFTVGSLPSLLLLLLVTLDITWSLLPLHSHPALPVYLLASHHREQWSIGASSKPVFTSSSSVFPAHWLYYLLWKFPQVTLDFPIQWQLP